MPTIYVAGPLFSQAELDFNRSVDGRLHELGYETFLPQEEGDEMSAMLARGMSRSDAQSTIFDLCVRGIDSSDALLFIMDGRVPDEGACFELGYAYAKGTPCIGLKTDPRTSIEGLDNPMIIAPLHGSVSDLDSLGPTLSTVLGSWARSDSESAMRHSTAPVRKA